MHVANKCFNFSSMEGAIWVILDAALFLFSGILAASVRVNEFPNDFTALMRYFFTNSSSVKSFECLTIRNEIAYDAVTAFYCL